MLVHQFRVHSVDQQYRLTRSKFFTDLKLCWFKVLLFASIVTDRPHWPTVSEVTDAKRSVPTDDLWTVHYLINLSNELVNLLRALAKTFKKVDYIDKICAFFSLNKFILCKFYATDEWRSFGVAGGAHWL